MLVAGCASLAPEWERPAAPVAATYPDSSGAAAATPAASLDWSRFFAPDPVLEQLIADALQNNRDLRVAVLAIEQARAQWQIQRANQVPTLNVAAAATRQTNATGGITDAYLVGLSVPAFELDFFGRVANLSDAARAQYLATEEARKTAQIALVAAVANATIALRADESALALTQRTFASREASQQLTRLRFDNGVASAIDVAQSTSLVEGARVANAALKRQKSQDENLLVLLVGRPLAFPMAGGQDLASMTFGAELAAGLPSELLTRRPDIRQAEQQLRAANANIGAARAAFFPRITLTGSAGLASGDLLNLFQPGTLAWAFTPQLVLPIFDGGRNQANLEVAQAQQQIAIAQYERAIQGAFREVADALAGRATLTEQLQAQEAQVEAEAARLSLAELRYDSGVASYLDVLDAQRSLFVAQLAAVQVRLAQLQNRVTLYKVLGGGWTEAASN
ncbi:MAG TPA: efflux transporter outer membrane subunit [Burkholderiaceae bacterium]|nr:efflux transporter outer membrane subunit [Burkholderiaceae bacterium]